MKVLLVDDHRLVLDGIRGALAAYPEFEIVGEARKGSEVLPSIRKLRPEVVLLDIHLPEMDGLVCLDLIRERHPEVTVVMLSVYDDAEHVHAALSRGAAAYVVKSIKPTDLPAALSQAVEGTVYNALGVTEDDEDRIGSNHGLTERELAILRCVTRGLSNRAIGRELWVTEQTVKFHLTNIYKKLGVANRTEAARTAYKLGLAESPMLEIA